MGLFSRKNRDVEVALVFDIGSASVGSALVLLRKSKKPQMLYQTRRDMPLSEDLDFSRFAQAMRTTLESVSEEMVSRGLAHLTFKGKRGKRVDYVSVMYASPWYASQVQALSVSHKEPTTVSKSAIDAIVEKEKNELLDSEETRSGSTKEDVIEQAVTDIAVDGYTLQNPYGKKAKRLEFTLALTALAGGVRRQVEEIILRHVNPSRIHHHSFTLVGFYTLTRLFPAISDALICDVSGEVTDISVVRENKLRGSASFPKGTRFIARTIAQALHMTPREALSVLRNYQEGVLHPDMFTGVTKALQDASQAWQGSFSKVIEKLGEDGAVPHTVFLAVDTALEKPVKDFIESGSVSDRHLTAKAFSVVLFSGGKLAQHAGLRAGSAPDTFLGLLTLYTREHYSMLQ